MRSVFLLTLATVLLIGASLPLRTVHALPVERVISPGGIEAWLVRETSVPVTAIAFTFAQSGAQMDPPHLPGLGRMTAALIDEGAGPLDSTAFQGRLNDLSIELNFISGRDMFSGMLYSLNRTRDEAVELLRLALTEPRFDEEPVARMRRSLMAGLRREETDPGALAANTMRETLFGTHAYGRPVAGTTDSITRITVADMRAWLRDALSRDRLHIGVVGDITPAELGPILDRLFGALPATGPLPEIEDATLHGAGELAVIDLDEAQSTIRFALPGLKREHPDYYTAVVLNHILGGGAFSSRLTKAIRVDRGLAYSVYSYLDPMDHAGLLRGGLATRNASAGEAVDLVKSVLADMRDNGIPEAEIADARTHLTGAYPLRFTNSQAIARQLAGIKRAGLGIDYTERRNALIDDVTAADVNRLAKRLLAPEKLLFTVAGRPVGVTPSL